MKASTRLLLLLLAGMLAGGPALAAAPLHRTDATIAAPAGAPPLAVELLKVLAFSAAAFGAIRIKDTATLANKYVTRAGQAVPEYKSGVEQAGADWESNAKAGEANYEQGVTEAIGKKRYGRGISAAGASKYVTNAANLGAQRYQPGVANAKDAWSRGVQPSLDKLKSLTLPPKGPRRSMANQQRANMVALELGKLKDAS